MNHAYCPECGSTQYDTNHRCMNCGHAVWVMPSSPDKVDEGLAVIEKVKEKLPEILAKMRRI